MQQHPLLVLLLSTFVVEAGFLFLEHGPSSTQGMGWKVGFFILMPLGLSLLVWLQFRWSAAVCVFYATVGLAIDIATMVQVSSTASSDALAPMVATIISGLFYFCLILFGWQSFLAMDQGLMPPKFRPPNPPSLS
jgi:hypothetical protein